MAICREKPDSLPPLDAIGLEPSDMVNMVRGGSYGHRPRSGGMGPPAARQPSVGLGFEGVNNPKQVFSPLSLLMIEDSVLIIGGLGCY